MYTRNEILFESEYRAYCTKLSITSDMIMDNYMEIITETTDLDEFYEAENGVIEAIRNFISKICEQISKLFNNIAAKVSTDNRKKAIAALKRKLNDAKAAGARFVHGPYPSKLKKIVDKSKQFVMKAKNELKAKLDSLMKTVKAKSKKVTKVITESDDLSGREKKKLEKEIYALCASLDKSYSQIEKEFEDAMNNAEDIPIDTVISMADDGIDYAEEVRKCGEEMSAAVEEFTDLLKEYQEIVESVNSDSLSVFQESESGGGVRAVFTKVINTIKKFLDKHAWFMQKLLGYLEFSTAVYTIGHVPATFSAAKTIGIRDKEDAKNVAKDLAQSGGKVAAGAAAHDVVHKARQYYRNKDAENKATKKAEREQRRADRNYINHQVKYG